MLIPTKQLLRDTQRSQQAHVSETKQSVRSLRLYNSHKKHDPSKISQDSLALAVHFGYLAHHWQDIEPAAARAAAFNTADNARLEAVMNVEAMIGAMMMCVTSS